MGHADLHEPPAPAVQFLRGKSTARNQQGNAVEALAVVLQTAVKIRPAGNGLLGQKGEGIPGQLSAPAGIVGACHISADQHLPPGRGQVQTHPLPAHGCFDFLRRGPVNAVPQPPQKGPAHGNALIGGVLLGGFLLGGLLNVVDHLFQRGLQLVHVQRLRQVVYSAVANGLPGILKALVAGHEGKLCIQTVGSNEFQNLHAVAEGHSDVAEHQLRLLLQKELLGRVPVVGSENPADSQLGPINLVLNDIQG